MKKFLLLIFAVTSLFAHAQWSNYSVENTSNNYLKENVLAIKSDSKGNVWFGTNGGGLIKFDGHNWTSYLAGSIIRDIEIDSSGNLWIASNGTGTIKYDGTNFTYYIAKNSTSPYNNVFSIAIDKNGYKWIATDGGIACYTGTVWKYINYTYGLGYVQARAVAVDSSGGIWAGYGWGSFGSLIKLTSWTTYLKYSDDVFLLSPVKDIAIDTQSQVWVATSGFYAVKISGNGITTYDYKSSFTYSTINSIAVDKEGTVWFATPLGVTTCDIYGSWGYFKKSNSNICSNSVYKVSVDNDGNKWFGTNNGASFYDGEVWKSYNEDNKLISNIVYGVWVDHEGNKWIKFNGGLCKYDGSYWSNYGIFNARLASESNKYVWCSTDYVYDGKTDIYRINGNSWTYIEAPTSTQITSIAVDKNRVKWVGTAGDGFFSYNDTTWTTYRSNNSSDTVYQIAIDNKNQKWLATQGGVIMHDDVSFLRYNSQNSGLINDHVHFVVIGTDGDIYFGSDGGVSMFDGYSWKTYQTAPIIDMSIDSKGILWLILSEEGSFLKRSLACFDGLKWKYFNNTNCELNTELLYSVSIDKNDNKWIGSDQGIWMYNDNTSAVSKTQESLVEYVLYPNPSHNQITFETKIPIIDPSNVLIYSMDGRLLLSMNIINQKSEIDISSLPKGMYMCRIVVNGIDLKNSKIIKE